MLQIFRAVNRQPSDLFYYAHPLYLSQAFCISQPSLVTASIHSIITHKGLKNSANRDDYPIGASILIGYRGPCSACENIPTMPSTVAARQANPPKWIDRTGQNINGVAEHYWSATISTQKDFEPSAPGVETWFQIEGWAFAQTDSAGLANTNGVCYLAQDNVHDLTRMDIRVETL